MWNSGAKPRSSETCGMAAFGCAFTAGTTHEGCLATASIDRCCIHSGGRIARPAAVHVNPQATGETTWVSPKAVKPKLSVQQPNRRDMHHNIVACGVYMTK